MIQTIEIPDEIFRRLEGHATGFNDSPANVIERLLNYYENRDDETRERHEYRLRTNGKDYTRYEFNGQDYGKGKLVLAVIEDYVSQHPSISFSELLDKFPKRLQGSLGVFQEYSKADEIFRNSQYKRHYLKNKIKLADCDIAVCSQWGRDNIHKFIKNAEALGYTINRV